MSQREYFKIMKNADNLSARPSDNIDDTKPVENVSWNDINSTFLPFLINWKVTTVCQMVGHTPFPQRLNGNLVEAEHQQAFTKDFSFFDLSNVSIILEQFARAYANTSKIGGSYNSNAWGFYDMHGNIEEWVSDWYADYNTSNLIDPTGPPTGDKKTTRGGNYYDHPKYARSAARYKLESMKKGRNLVSACLKKVE